MSALPSGLRWKWGVREVEDVAQGYVVSTSEENIQRNGPRKAQDRHRELQGTLCLKDTVSDIGKNGDWPEVMNCLGF